MRCLIIIPAFNEAPVIKQVISNLRQHAKDFDLVVINDGSTDHTSQILSQIPQITVLTHVINRGLGAAIGTGLEYARRRQYQLAITFDADGQHDPQDIKAIVKPLINHQADVVIGSRLLFNSNQIPLDRQLIIKASNLLTQLLYQRTTTDSLSGFRAFSQTAIDHLRLKTDRMEVSNEFFSEIKRLNLLVKEVPIKVRYTKYSRSKGQKNLNAISVIFRLVLRLFR